MLRDKNGQPYKPQGSIQQFDPESTQHCLFNLWDQEAIKMGGSPIFYHEVIINAGDIHPTYLEARSKLFNPVPIQLWAIYEPSPQVNFQDAFGLDSPGQVIFECNYQDVLKRIGHPPKLQSRIHTPHKGEDWEILQLITGEYKMWGELRLQIVCEKFQDSVTMDAGVVKQKREDFKIN